jgi:hypothetical protein
MILPPFDGLSPQFDHGKLCRIRWTMYAPDRLDQVNTIGIFQPNSGTVGHEIIVRFETHAATFCWRAVGHAPKMPLF